MNEPLPAAVDFTDKTGEARRGRIGDRCFYAAVLLLLACGAIVGLAGINAAPLDAHESFVVETAREMSERGNWIVPYFDYRLRLNKPPLSYWATGLVAWVAGDLPEIEPWHARVPSFVAGLGLALLTLYIGLRLYGRTVAVLATALLVTCSGFFSYTHDARSDMMYAFWVTAMFAAFVSIMGARQAGAPDRYWRSALMWACFGVAVLAKGPHLPLLILVAQVLYLARDRCRAAEIYRIVRPVSGIVLMLAIALPWWLALAGQVGLDTVRHSQLGGALLRPRAGGIIVPYYLYEAPLLLLPWIPVAVLAGAALLQRTGRPAIGILMFPLLVAVLGLSLGAQARLVYVLPLLPLVCLLLAVGLSQTVAMARGDRVGLGSLAAVSLQLAVLLAAGIWYFTEDAPAPVALSVLLGAVMALGAIALFGLLVNRTKARAVTAFGAALLLGCVLWPTLAATDRLWSAERFDNHRLAQTARASVGADTPLAAYAMKADIFVYYTHREIHVLDQRGEIEQLLGSSPTGELGLLTVASALPGLSREFAVKEIARTKNDGKSIVLVRLSEKPAAQ